MRASLHAQFILVKSSLFGLTNEAVEASGGDETKVKKPKAGKISTRKYLVQRAEPIGIFMKDHYTTLSNWKNTRITAIIL